MPHAGICPILFSSAIHSSDGVHLAGKGYDVWAKEVERFVNDRINLKKTSGR
jgi:lysophospholipase L1-like esterase